MADSHQQANNRISKRVSSPTLPRINIHITRRLLRPENTDASGNMAPTKPYEAKKVCMSQLS